MLNGILYALLAGLLWGLIFVGPLLVPDYPAALQSAGRYFALGLLCLPVAWLGRKRLGTLQRHDWLTAFALSTVGNLIYYFCLAAAIQRTGAPVTTMIIGTLPVVIPLAANVLYHQQEGRIAWRRLAPALGMIMLGLLFTNIAELQQRQEQTDMLRFCGGIALAILAVVCWAWYALRNARWLRNHPDKPPMLWATAQGLTTLPLSFAGYLLVSGWLMHTSPDFTSPFGPQPWRFVSLMLTIALLCSWAGSVCWNSACQRLPTVIVGPLIVFETLAGLTYTFLLRQSMPPLLTLAGIVCLMGGVVVALCGKLTPAVTERKS